MPHLDVIPAGSPCWLELGTTDQAAAKRFYMSLFNWSVQDSQMGPDSFYSTFEIDGRPVGAAYTLDREQQAQGLSPHWMVYFSVESADDTVAKASALGGKIIVEPMDVMTFGRMAILQDPTGAVFSIWQPRDHKGFGIGHQANTIIWSELATRDLEEAGRFYSALFSWKLSPHPASPEGYLVCENAGQGFGGLQKMTEEWGETPPHWGIYWHASDCRALAARVKEIGGTIMTEPFEIAGVGTIAICADPQSAYFSLLQPESGL